VIAQFGDWLSAPSWLDNLLDRDAQDFSMRAVAVGMHEALPDSF